MKNICATAMLTCGMALAKRAQSIYGELDGRKLAIRPMTGGATDAGYAARSGKAPELMKAAANSSISGKSSSSGTSSRTLNRSFAAAESPPEHSLQTNSEM